MPSSEQNSTRHRQDIEYRYRISNTVRSHWIRRNERYESEKTNKHPYTYRTNIDLTLTLICITMHSSRLQLYIPSDHPLFDLRCFLYPSNGSRCCSMTFQGHLHWVFLSHSLVTNTFTLRNKCDLLADCNIVMHVSHSHTAAQKTRHSSTNVAPRRSFFFRCNMNLY